jgi:hypothetical protein
MTPDLLCNQHNNPIFSTSCIALSGKFFKTTSANNADISQNSNLEQRKLQTIILECFIKKY